MIPRGQLKAEKSGGRKGKRKTQQREVTNRIYNQY